MADKNEFAKRMARARARAEAEEAAAEAEETAAVAAGPAEAEAPPAAPAPAWMQELAAKKLKKQPSADKLQVVARSDEKTMSGGSPEAAPQKQAIPLAAPSVEPAASRASWSAGNEVVVQQATRAPLSAAGVGGVGGGGGGGGDSSAGVAQLDAACSTPRTVAPNGFGGARSTQQALLATAASELEAAAAEADRAAAAEAARAAIAAAAKTPATSNGGRVAAAAAAAAAVAFAAGAGAAPPPLPPPPPPDASTMAPPLPMRHEPGGNWTVTDYSGGLSADLGADGKNHTLWTELVGVRAENSALEHELGNAHHATDRLNLILSGISDRLRAQMEALVAAGLHTEERVRMFGQLKELLAYEEQFKAAQAQHALTSPPKVAIGGATQQPVVPTNAPSGTAEAPPLLPTPSPPSALPACTPAPPSEPKLASPPLPRPLPAPAPPPPAPVPPPAEAPGRSTSRHAPAASYYAAELMALAERTPLPSALTPLARPSSLNTVGVQAGARSPADRAEAEASATASVLSAVAAAAAEASAARARAEAAVGAANRRAAAEIAEVRTLAKSAVAQAREEAAAAIREANAEARAARLAAAALEEELRKEQAKAKEQRASHQAEVERLRAKLAAVQKESQHYRQRNSFDALTSAVVAPPKPSPPQRQLPPPQPPPLQPPDNPPVANAQSIGDALLDRIVLSRHFEYFNNAPPPQDRQPSRQLMYH